MKVVTTAGVLVLALVLMFFILVAVGRAAVNIVKGLEVVAALLALDAAQDAEERGDEALSTAAAAAAALFALLPLFLP